MPLVLWAVAPAVGWLAARGGMGWELATALGVVLAVAAGLARRRAARLGCLIGGCELLLGAGHWLLPAEFVPVLAAMLLLPAGLMPRRRVRALRPVRPVLGMRPAAAAPFLLAERAPDGTLRMALMGRPDGQVRGRLRVTIS